MMTPTYFGLLAEFGEAEIPLQRVCEKYFGLSVSKGKKTRLPATTADTCIPCRLSKITMAY